MIIAASKVVAVVVTSAAVAGMTWLASQEPMPWATWLAIGILGAIGAIGWELEQARAARDGRLPSHGVMIGIAITRLMAGGSLAVGAPLLYLAFVEPEADQSKLTAVGFLVGVFGLMVISILSKRVQKNLEK